MQPAFFRGETLPKRNARDLRLAAHGHENPSLRVPGAGMPDIVIAPDLSNLPPGATVVDPGEGDAGGDDPPAPSRP